MQHLQSLLWCVATVFLLTGIRLEETVKQMLNNELGCMDPNDRVKSLQRWETQFSPSMSERILAFLLVKWSSMWKLWGQFFSGGLVELPWLFALLKLVKEGKNSGGKLWKGWSSPPPPPPQWRHSLPLFWLTTSLCVLWSVYLLSEKLILQYVKRPLQGTRLAVFEFCWQHQFPDSKFCGSPGTMPGQGFKKEQNLV